MLMVPAVPGVSVPVTAARVSVLLTTKVAFEPTLTTPTPVPPLLPQTKDEKRRYEGARLRVQARKERRKAEAP